MTPEATWNAEQLDEWLDYLLDKPMFSVQNAFSDMKVNPNQMQSSAPEVYKKLMSRSNALYMNYMTDASRRAEDLRQQLRACRDRLIMNADKIANLIDYLRDDTTCDRDKIRYSRQLEAAAAAIREDRATVVAHYQEWLDQIDDLHDDFTGVSHSSTQAFSASNDAASEMTQAGLYDWANAVMSWHEEPIKTTVAVDLHPDGRNNSVLAKLSVAHSALAAQETDPETIHVISDKQFVINLNTPIEQVEPTGSTAPSPAPSPMPVVNGRVTVWDAKEVKTPIPPIPTRPPTRRASTATPRSMSPSSP